MTAQPRFDGTFSSDAVALAAHALVAHLHDEAMATIAGLAESWGRPADEAPAAEEEPVVYRDPASWSVDEDEPDLAEDDEDDVRVLPRLDLPPLLPRPRRVTLDIAAADVTTDELALPAHDVREYAVL